MFRLRFDNAARRVQIVSALVEGNSIRATSRMTGAAKGTVLKLLADIGPQCVVYHDEHAPDLSSLRVQCDEIWSFVHAKAKNVPAKLDSRWGYGDVWTRYAAHAAAIDHGWETVNGVRALEDRPPLDGGDESMSPLAMATQEDRRVAQLQRRANAAATLIRAGMDEAAALRTAGLPPPAPA